MLDGAGEIFGRFYAIDWLGVVFTLLQIYTLGSKKRAGFLFGLAGNTCWSVFGVLSGATSVLVVNLLLACMNVRGYVRWHGNLG